MVADELAGSNIATLASTPILLLMIAMTWVEHKAAGRAIADLDRTRLYESFFRTIARGKFDGDTDEHCTARLQLLCAHLD